MRTVLIIIFLIITAFLAFGFYSTPENLKTREFCIGIGITGLFFVWMPLFIYHRWRKKSVKDYMLNKENLDKMRQEGRKKKL
jgi:hypothetical protein